MLEKVRSPDRKKENLISIMSFPEKCGRELVIAIGLACDPQLLIADEPTTAGCNDPGIDPRADQADPAGKRKFPFC